MHVLAAACKRKRKERKKPVWRNGKKCPEFLTWKVGNPNENAKQICLVCRFKMLLLRTFCNRNAVKYAVLLKRTQFFSGKGTARSFDPTTLVCQILQ